MRCAMLRSTVRPLKTYSDVAPGGACGNDIKEVLTLTPAWRYNNINSQIKTFGDRRKSLPAVKARERHGADTGVIPGPTVKVRMGEGSWRECTRGVLTPRKRPSPSPEGFRNLTGFFRAD